MWPYVTGLAKPWNMQIAAHSKITTKIIIYTITWVSHPSYFDWSAAHHRSTDLTYAPQYVSSDAGTIPGSFEVIQSSMFLPIEYWIGLQLEAMASAIGLCYGYRTMAIGLGL